MIYIRNYQAPGWNISEVMRYAGIRRDDASYRPLIEECIKEAEPLLSYRVCYTYLDVDRYDDRIDLGVIKTTSNTIKKAIGSAERVLLFAATVGAPFDRLIQKYSKIQPSKAIIMQAVGAERIESLCDAFCDDIDAELRSEEMRLRTRVSPGYGDIPMETQRDIFTVLDCPRKIGLTLDESLLMSPSKSVTALCGIVDEGDTVEKNRCDECSKTDCVYR